MNRKLNKCRSSSHAPRSSWIAVLAGSVCAIALASQSAYAQEFVTQDPRFPQSVTIPLVDAGGQQAGEFTVTENPAGPDDLKLTIFPNTLVPGSRYTVFLTQSNTLGALPAQFLGEFTLNPPTTFEFDGQTIVGNEDTNVNVFSVKTEIVDAFASANTSLQDANGVADVVAAGARALGANTIPLRWIRIYQANGNISVFGGNPFEVGGGLLLTAGMPIEIPFIPIVANAGGDFEKTIQAGVLPPDSPFAAALDRTVIIGTASEGDIISYVWEVVAADKPFGAPETAQISPDKFVFFPQQLEDGDQFTVRLTVTGRDGDVSVDETTVTFVAP